MEQTNVPAQFDLTEAAIQQMRDEFLTLKTNGIEDKAAYNAVDEARKKVKKIRLAIDKRRMALNEEALKHQRMVNSTAKELTEKITPIELHLQSEQDKVDNELERIEAEKTQALEKRYLARVKKLSEYGMTFNGKQYTLGSLTWDIEALRGMEDHEFGICETLAKKEYEKKKAEDDAKAEELRKANEEAEQAKLQAAALLRDTACMALDKYKDIIPPDHQQRVVEEVMLAAKGSPSRSIMEIAAEIVERYKPVVVDPEPESQPSADQEHKSANVDLTDTMPETQEPILDKGPLHAKVGVIADHIRTLMPECGYVLFVAPFGSAEGECHSNLELPDMIKVLEMQLKHFKNLQISQQ